MDGMHDEDAGSLNITNITKKNKLGYTRISIACEHCRRRKIRCVKDDESNEKCANCTKLGKECIFTNVDASQASDSRSKAKKGTSSGASSAFHHSPTGPHPDVYDAMTHARSSLEAPYMDGHSSYADGVSAPQGLLAASFTRPFAGDADGMHPRAWSNSGMDGYGAPHLQHQWQGGDQMRNTETMDGARNMQAMRYGYPGAPPLQSHPGTTWAAPDSMMAPTYHQTMQQPQYYHQTGHENFSVQLEHRLSTLQSTHGPAPLAPQQYYGSVSGAMSAPSMDGRQHMWQGQHSQRMPQGVPSIYLAANSRHDSMQTSYTRGTSYSSVADALVPSHPPSQMRRPKKENSGSSDPPD